MRLIRLVLARLALKVARVSICAAEMLVPR
jgi:hypothetical protein